MQSSSNPFEWLGSALGTIIRVVLDSLVWLFETLSSASSSFVNGFARALGVSNDLLTIVAVLLGLFLIYLGVRRFLRKRWVGGVIWVLLGLWLLSALIR